MDEQLDQLRQAIQAAKSHTESEIGQAQARRSGRNEAEERMRMFISEELAPALESLSRDVADHEGQIITERTYNDATQHRIAITGELFTPGRSPFQAELEGTIGRTGELFWSLAVHGKRTQRIEDGTSSAICRAILSAYTDALSELR